MTLSMSGQGDRLRKILGSPRIAAWLLAGIAGAASAQMPPATSEAGWNAASQGFRRTGKTATLPPSGSPRDLGRDTEGDLSRLNSQRRLFGLIARILSAVPETP